MFENFSEIERSVTKGSVNIFCSRSSCLDCSFILSESDPSLPIKKFSVCNGAFQQVVIPLSPDEPKICRLSFTILKRNIDEEVVVILYSCNGWLAFRLSDYIKSNLLPSSQEKYCDLAICNLSSGIMLPILTLTCNPPGIFSGIGEIRKLVSFVNNSKFAVSKFFGFDEEQMDNHAQEYTLTLREAEESLKNYEIHGDLEYLLASIRCDSSGAISLALIERNFPIWQELVKQTEYLVVDESFEDDEEFDPDQTLSDEDDFGKNEFAVLSDNSPRPNAILN